MICHHHFFFTDKQVQQLKLLPQQFVGLLLSFKSRFGICAEDPMIKNEESIAAGNDYGRLAHLKTLNGTTQNACVPIWLYSINLQIREKQTAVLA